MLRQRKPLQRRTSLKLGKGFKKRSGFKRNAFLLRAPCYQHDSYHSDSSSCTEPYEQDDKARRNAKPKGINPIGKTGRKNQNAVKIQTEAFEYAGIWYCELDIEHDCDGALHFSHSKKKSRGITEDERIYLVIRQCDHSHAKLTEGKPDQERQILRIILARGPINHPFFREAETLAQTVWDEKYAE